MKIIFFVLILIFFNLMTIFTHTTAFIGVNLIPMDMERVLQNQTVNSWLDEIAPKIQNALTETK